MERRTSHGWDSDDYASFNLFRRRLAEEDVVFG